MKTDPTTTSPDNNLPEQQSLAKEKSAVSSASRENALGWMLLAVILIVVLALVGWGGWYGYRQWCVWRSFGERVSIAQLPDFEPPRETLPSSEPSPVVQEGKENDDKAAGTEKIRKETPVSVLNGGAPKGSAAMLAETVKKEGFTKVATGNTTSDYAGTSVYYAVGYESEAKALHRAVLGKYPQAALVPSDAKNKETTTASLTIIVGK